MVEPERANVRKADSKKKRAAAFSNPKKFLDEAQALPSPNRRQLASEAFENMRRKGKGRGKEQENYSISKFYVPQWVWVI